MPDITNATTMAWEEYRATEGNAHTPIDWMRVYVQHTTERDGYTYTFPGNVQITIPSNQLESIPPPERARYIEELYFRQIQERRQEAMSKEVEEIRMTLNDVAVCLGKYFHTEKYPDGIEFTENFDGHKYCYIDTNCPEAVKIRKFLDEAGITVEELHSVWVEVATLKSKPEPRSYSLPNLSGKLIINVAGKDVELDMKEELSHLIRQSLHTTLDYLKYAESDVQAISNDLFRHYYNLIRESKRDKILPQLGFSLGELLKCRCMITSEGSKDTYYFIFPVVYAPQWLYARNIRYKLHNKHIEAMRRELYLVIPITVDGKFLIPYLVKQIGVKFQHYHGTDRDCWGDVPLPTKWDRTLKSVVNLVKHMEKALTTINEDSLMIHNPIDMPNIIELKKKAKVVGKEGDREEGAEEVVVEGEDTDASAPRLWGESTTTDGRDGIAPIEVTEERR